MSSPFFSIITCTYNSEHYLDQCIRSVKEQQFDDYEHIIVDAFSTDKTPDIIDAYAKNNHRVRVIQAAPKGISNAMNIGVLNSKGKVIQHLHGDDYLYSDQTLSTVHEAFLNNPRKSLVIGLCPRDVNGIVESRFLAPSTFNRRRLLLKYLIYVHSYIAHPATFILKSVFDTHGLFDESFRIAMDYEFWLRILGKEPYLMVNRELTVFREHEVAASFNQDKCSQEELRARKLHSRKFRAFIARAFFVKAVEMKEKYNLKKKR